MNKQITKAKTKQKILKPKSESKGPQMMVFNAQRGQVSVPKTKISQENQDYIVQMLDPYHDFRRQLAGYPDMSSGNSLVTRTQERLNITAPAGLAANETWQAHIFTTPIQTSDFGASSQHGSVSTSGVATAGPGRAMKQTFIQCWTGKDTDVDLVWDGASGTVTNTGYRYQVATQRGGMRMLGAGFEVCNTTAEIYRNGSVTHYRVPWVTTVGVLDSVDAGVHTTKSVFHYSGVPTTLAQAQNTPGSTTWLAKDGSYCVCTPRSADNPMTMPAFHEPVMCENPYSISTPTRVIANVGALTRTGGPSVYHINTMDCSGAWYYGLLPQTTLTLTVTMYIEYIPDPSDITLLSLSTPMAAYDPRVIELLSAVYAQLPVAARKDDNDAGDFFRKLLGIIGKVGTALGTGLAIVPGFQEFAPIAGAIGAGANAAASRMPTRVKGDGVPR